MLLFQALFRRSLWLDFKWFHTRTHTQRHTGTRAIEPADSCSQRVPSHCHAQRLRGPCAIPAPSTSINVCAMINMPNSWQYLLAEVRGGEEGVKKGQQPNA